MSDLHILQSPLPPRSALVGSRSRRPHPLLPLSSPLPHRPRPIRLLFHPRQPGRQTLQPRYASPAALQVDPIEKKPLSHFLPGTKVFSIGTAGCNMGCFFCQNWDISKSHQDQVNSKHLPPNKFLSLPCNTAAIPSLSLQRTHHLGRIHH